MSKSSALSGKRVLVTRPAHQSEEFAEALRSLGAQPVLAPTIAIVPPDDPGAAAQAVYAAAEYTWIVFTSANGVDAFFDLLDERREDARALGGAKIAAIGIKTSRALRARCIYADLVPQSFIAEDLAQALVVASKPGDRVLVFRAQEARDVLPEQLREAGLDVSVVAAYKTILANDPQIREKTAICDILTFTSASTVRGFVQSLGGEQAAAEASRGKIVACIGPITAAQAREAGLSVAAVAREYTAEGLIEALESPASA